MKMRFVSMVTAGLLIAGIAAAGYVFTTSASWMLSSPETAVTAPALPIPTAELTAEPEAPDTAERYDSVADYFRAGNPNATTYRLGEPWTKRKSFSRSRREKIHRENGGYCQVCGSTNELELEHRRGLQNGGGNERSNLGTLCHDCHVEKTSMDKSLRRQRDKLVKQKAKAKREWGGR